MGIANGVENRQLMQELFVFLAGRFGISNFVETGTYRGQTARFASAHFQRVVTIEGAESIYRVTKQKLSNSSNIECLCGDSRIHLAKIMPDLLGSTLFWLDAHWSGGETFGEHAECPLMEELAAIYQGSSAPFTIIDDARFFISVPPVPHDITAWPNYFQIAEMVRQHAPHTWIAVYADAIVLAPQWAAGALIEYLRQPTASVRQSSQAKGWFSWPRSRRKAA